MARKADPIPSISDLHEALCVAALPGTTPDKAVQCQLPGSQLPVEHVIRAICATLRALGVGKTADRMLLRIESGWWGQWLPTPTAWGPESIRFTCRYRNTKPTWAVSEGMEARIEFEPDSPQSWTDTCHNLRAVHDLLWGLTKTADLRLQSSANSTWKGVTIQAAEEGIWSGETELMVIERFTLVGDDKTAMYEAGAGSTKTVLAWVCQLLEHDLIGVPWAEEDLNAYCAKNERRHPGAK